MEGAMEKDLGEGDLGGVVAPELPLRPLAAAERLLVVVDRLLEAAAGRTLAEATTEAAGLTALVVVGFDRSGGVGGELTSPGSDDLAVTSGAEGWVPAEPGAAFEAAPDLAVDPVRGGRLTIGLGVVEEQERKGGYLGTAFTGQQGGSPVRFPKVDDSSNR